MVSAIEISSRWCGQVWNTFFCPEKVCGARRIISREPFLHARKILLEVKSLPQRAAPSSSPARKPHNNGNSSAASTNSNPNCDFFSSGLPFDIFTPVDTQHAGKAGGDSRAPQVRHAARGLSFYNPSTACNSLSSAIYWLTRRFLATHARNLPPRPHHGRAANSVGREAHFLVPVVPCASQILCN